MPLTPAEVASRLRVAKNTVYELVKRGELRAFKVGNQLRFHEADVAAYGGGAAPAPSSGAFVLCGQDTLLDVLAQRLEAAAGGPVLRSYLGSANGLAALYQGGVQAATAHLWDAATDTYNLPFLPHLLPGVALAVVTLAHRTVGLYVPQGNPRALAGWDDVGRADLVLANRERGSGMRVLLDQKLARKGLEPESLPGYGREHPSHLAAAAAVAQGAADYALGSERVARQVAGLAFVPLGQERYDLVFRQADADKPVFRALVAVVRSPAFRGDLEALGGYDTRETGRGLQGTL